LHPMDQTVIDDLKQFILALFSQQTADMVTKDDLKNFATKDDLKNLATKDDIARLDKKIDDRIDEVLVAIGDTMATHSEAIDEQLGDHETRIATLESKAA